MSRDRDDGDRGALDHLLALLETLAEMDEQGERRRDGRADVGRTSFDFSVGIGNLDDFADEFGGRDRPTDDDRRGRHSAGEDGNADEAHVDVRETETGVTVVADLPAVDADDVGVTVDDDAGKLRIVVGGETFGTAPLSGDELTITDATVRNRILEVHLERSEPET